MLDLLREDENAWQFERYGAIRSEQYGGFYVVYKDFFTLLNTVVKGKWVPRALRRLQQRGVDVKPLREVIEPFEAFRLRLYGFIYRLSYKFIPWKLRRKLVSIIIKEKG